MASLDTCEPSIDASRNTSAEPATGHNQDTSAANANDATVTPETTAQRTITPDASDANDDNPLIDNNSDPDVDACLRVLDNIAKDPAAFGTPHHRKLRGAVRAAHGALTAGDFGGVDLCANQPVRRVIRRAGTGGSPRHRAGVASMA